MNDVTLKELKTVVEQAVRPVRATMARKRKIREELLAHLMSIFEEEQGRLGDERVALDQSRRRFGDPRELVALIQAAIPRSDWCVRFADEFFLVRRGESAFAHAVRVAAFMFTSFAMTLVLLPSILWFRGRQYEIGRMELTCLVAAISLGGLSLVMTLLGHGLQQALFPRGDQTRSFLRGAVLALLSTLAVPILGFMLAWTATRDLVVGYAHFRSLWWSIVVVPVVMITAIWELTRVAQDDDEWASLEIEE